MISFIRGKIKIKNESFVVIENNDIGFKIFVSPRTLEKINLGEIVEFFIFFAVRNEKPELYGLLTEEELKVFEIIEKISGIGPKGAMLIASLGTFEELKKAVENQDFGFFSKIKGIGKKKIQKIILELGGTLRKLDEKEPSDENDEALKGLIALGFSVKESKKALESVPEDVKDTSQRVQQALRQFTAEK
ncbi:MAG: Holliday junction branch migration protein RuvA [Candidatus Parcubacteria bacterium]|nr:Holliday junction branch migration protein RuvA [Candidatus Parcubacteria bacterium]